MMAKKRAKRSGSRSKKRNTPSQKKRDRSSSSKRGKKKKQGKSRRPAKKARGPQSNRDKRKQPHQELSLSEELEFEADQEDDAYERGDDLPPWLQQLRRARQGYDSEVEIDDDDFLADDYFASPSDAGGSRRDSKRSQSKKRGAKKSSQRASSKKKYQGKRKSTLRKPREEEGRDKPDPSLAFDRLLGQLDLIRTPLFREWREAIKAFKEQNPEVRPHRLCTREFNQMRISDIEALSIVRAFRDEPGLRKRRDLLERLVAEEEQHLKKSRRRQNFTCPLLEGDRCLVHQKAKPIGCLSFQPSGDLTEKGRRALAARDRMNDRLINIEWDLRAIPVQLAKYLDGAFLEPGAVQVKPPSERRSKKKKKTRRKLGRRGRGKQRAQRRRER